jgi:dolichyl-phosphate beta-glucosyltransferase
MNQDRPALSIVIPARNEEQRLPKTLEMIRDWTLKSGRRTEVIPVVQGHDRTAEIVEAAAAKNPDLRPIIQHSGEGKGMAVRLGITAARGSIILFTDADLSVPVECLEELVCMMEASPEFDVILGSRRLPNSRITIAQPPMRQLSGKAFNLALRLGRLTRFADTQCGCKLFRHNTAKEIFAKSELNGFAFDVEILNIAEHLGYQIKEVPVTWADVGGSRVWLPRDGFRALRDAWALRKRFGC